MSLLVPYLQGGLGNQLFQIAACMSYASQLGVDWAIDPNLFGGARQGHPPEYYRHNLYDKVPFIESCSPDHRVGQSLYGYISLLTDLKALVKQEDICIRLDGFFLSEKYFHPYSDQIRYMFLPSQGIRDQLKNMYGIKEDDCLMGVRRGDFITYSNHHLPCSLDYYNEAIRLLPSKRYFIITDDYNWCRAKFTDNRFILLPIVDNITKFQFACCFSKYIISNSTFYWWGSFLSHCPTKNIVAPSHWLKGNADDIYREGMQVIQRFPKEDLPWTAVS